MVPGIRGLLDQLSKEIDALEQNVTPTWEGLVEPLERISDRLSRAWGTISHLKAVKDHEPLRKAYEEVQPKHGITPWQSSRIKPAMIVYSGLRTHIVIDARIATWQAFDTLGVASSIPCNETIVAVCRFSLRGSSCHSASPRAGPCMRASSSSRRAPHGHPSQRHRSALWTASCAISNWAALPLRCFLQPFMLAFRASCSMIASHVHALRTLYTAADK